MGRVCPRCAVELEARAAGGIEVDLCGSCGGVFLDESEFDAAIARRFEGKNLESLFAILAGDVPDPRACPACNTAMQELDYEDIEIDRCPGCAGIWIDGDERGAFARRAEEAAAPPPPTFVSCGGCGARVPQRVCIRRMEAFWCEDCVVAGNHPGPEAALVGTKQMQVDAALALARGRAQQASTRDAIQAAKDRNRAMRYRFRPIATDLAIIEAISRYISDLFSRR